MRSRLSAGATAPLPGELFTQSFKSAGYTIACTLNWSSLFVLGMVFPVIVVSIVLFWSNVAKCEWNITHADTHISSFLSRSVCMAFVSSYFCFSVPAVACLWGSMSRRPRIRQLWRSLQRFRWCTTDLKNHGGNKTSSRPKCDCVHQGLSVKHLAWRSQFILHYYTFKFCKLWF